MGSGGSGASGGSSNGGNGGWGGTMNNSYGGGGVGGSGYAGTMSGGAGGSGMMGYGGGGVAGVANSGWGGSGGSAGRQPAGGYTTMDSFGTVTYHAPGGLTGPGGSHFGPVGYQHGETKYGIVTPPTFSTPIPTQTNALTVRPGQVVTPGLLTPDRGYRTRPGIDPGMQRSPESLMSQRRSFEMGNLTGPAPGSGSTAGPNRAAKGGYGGGSTKGGYGGGDSGGGHH